MRMRPHLKSGRGAGEGDLVHIDIGSHNVQEKEDEKYPDEDEGVIDGEGLKKKKKKRRGRPRKSKPVKVEIVHKMPYERFSHAPNESLRQLLEAQELKHKADINQYISKDMDKIKGEMSRLQTERDFYKGALGEGLGKRPAKGTPEMKEWMAKLRSLKKK